MKSSSIAKYEKPVLIDLMAPEWEVGSGQDYDPAGGHCNTGGSASAKCEGGALAHSSNICGPGSQDSSACGAGSGFR